MLDGLAADAHGAGFAVEPALHSVEDRLVLPAGDATVDAGRAAGFEIARPATRQVPVAVQGQPVLDIGHGPGQLLACRTEVGVLLRRHLEVQGRASRGLDTVREPCIPVRARPATGRLWRGAPPSRQ